VTRRPSRAKTAAGAGARNVTRKVLPGPRERWVTCTGCRNIPLVRHDCDTCFGVGKVLASAEITAGHTDAPHVSDVIARVHADYRGTEPAPGTRRILPAPTDGAGEGDE
jgi:DnaJ-class molecular chaperone